MHNNIHKYHLLWFTCYLKSRNPSDSRAFASRLWLWPCWVALSCWELPLCWPSSWRQPVSDVGTAVDDTTCRFFNLRNSASGRYPLWCLNGHQMVGRFLMLPGNSIKTNTLGWNKTRGKSPVLIKDHMYTYIYIRCIYMCQWVCLKLKGF